MTAAPRAPLSPYQRRLFGFLSVATFFEGYDFFALTQLLTNIRREFQLDFAAAGWLLSVINAGTVLAYLLVGVADRWGRRRVLSVTILGYTTFTLLSGLAPNVWFFGGFQLLARVFLIGEWATSMVIAAEEFPADRRGTVIGVVQAASALGGVVCAGVVPVVAGSFGWRSIYFIGVVPLLLLAWARRGMRETERFERVRVEERTSLFAIFRTPYRRRVLELGAIWFLTYVCTQNGVTVWKDYALGELQLSDKQAAFVITIAALASMPLSFFAGKLFDSVGRRRGAALAFACLIAGIFGIYGFSRVSWLVVGMILAMFGINATLSVLNAFTTELFPTSLRGSAFAWSNNVIGRTGYWLSPLAIGQLAQGIGWGPVIRGSIVFPIVAVVLLLLWLPETSGRELEDTASFPEPGKTT
jgi:MFS transporter, putative metabolite:H+ symporter